MPIPFWAGRYIGLPFREHGRDRAGLDCWGLVRLVMGEQYNLALPSFATSYDRTTNAESIGRLIRRETRGWRAIELGHEDTGDVAVLRMRGEPMHVGVVLGDRQMLHIEQGIDSAIEHYDCLRWKDRVCGFYRYKNFLDELEYDAG